jgi:hypothetical protein
MRVEVKNPRWMMDSDGAWVSFMIPSPVEARAICESMKPGERYTAEIKKLRKKRSKNANDLLWELCTQISERLAWSKLYVSKEEVYRQHIRDAGVCEFVAVPEKAVESLMTGWGKNGIGWFAEVVDFIPGKEIQGCKKVCLYYGSSSYDTAEMSRLLGSVIQQASDMGIEVMSESDRALLEGL